MDESPQRSKLRRLSRLWPWLLGAAIVIVLARRVPLDAFRAALGEGPHVQLALVDLAVALALLFLDTFATWVGLITLRLRWPLRRILAIRGATYVLAVVNYVAGQGGLGYYLHRAGIPGLRAAGTTLYLMGTTFATLLVLTTVSWAFGGHTVAPTIWWVLLGGCAAFALYLIVIAIAPRALASLALLAPLFDARLRGHFAAVSARIPHVALLVLGHWFSMLAWGIRVPFLEAITLLPVVTFIAAVPISPAGLGTTQAAFVYFFSDYIAKATHDACTASMLAFSIVHFVYTIIWQFLMGLACVPAARRIEQPKPVS